MTCSCDFDTYPSIYDEIVRKARKEHTCSECRKTIKSNEYYVDINGLWDGEWENYKICSECHKLRMYIQENSDCFCAPLTGLYTGITDSYILEDLPEIESYNEINGKLIKVNNDITEDHDDYDENLNEVQYADYHLISDHAYKKFLIKYLKKYFKEWNSKFYFTLNNNTINCDIKDVGYSKKYVKNILKLKCLPFIPIINYISN